MKVSFEGVGEQVLSFASSEADASAFVKMSANDTVTACASGDRFMGLCLRADSDFAEVKTHGYVECAYTDTAPAVGYAKLVASTAGKVKAGTAGSEYLVLRVDATAGTVGFML